jgi:hypothetical protein
MLFPRGRLIPFSVCHTLWKGLVEARWTRGYFLDIYLHKSFNFNNKQQY